MADDVETSPHTVVYRTTKRRTFKACRTCRLQKARCIITGEKPPCKRCYATGRDCVFEELGSTSGKRGPPSSADPEIADKRPRYEDLEKEVVRLRRMMNITSSPLGSPHDQSNSLRPPRSTSHHGGTSVADHQTHPKPQSSVVLDGPARSESLTKMHLEAPITTVHEMTMDTLPPSPASIRGHTESISSTASGRITFPDSYCSMPGTRYDDVISRGIITESEGRKLFQLYMANANVFLPLFDPAVDTFDALRHRSTFCFTVVLAVALRADRPKSGPTGAGDICLAEAQKLTTRTLFASSTRLDIVQGMILLAANSDKNWFAISHAFQMGTDLGLLKLLPRVKERSESEIDIVELCERRLLQRIRTALILHQVELEVATGTARQSRGTPVKEGFLNALLRNKFSTTYDMRIVANVEIAQLREKLLRELENQENLLGTIHVRIEQIENDINHWFDRWDAALEEQDYGISCFQRSSIRLQRDYAFIIICSAIINKLSTESPPLGSGDRPAQELKEIIKLTLRRSMKILRFIAEDNDYKWYLQWAPTYSALFPAFTAALALCLAKMYPQGIDWYDLQSSFSTVAKILEEYPHQTFSIIIHDLSKKALSIAKRKPTLKNTVIPLTSEDQSNHVQLDEEGGGEQGGNPNEELGSSNGISATSQPAVDTSDKLGEANGWDINALSECTIPEHGFSTDQLGIQNSYEIPGFALDFNLFAASIQDYIDDEGSERI